ncbi:MAG: hypothetical protein NC132_01235 [Corallococcus sp.]|nr:hypothetical protein [Corallococcus sp.]MCM1359457.1 hypothetical protein [Corallococcus sp.]MCM1394731.1 hypothetical protein [Corallococcus sp.]
MKIIRIAVTVLFVAVTGVFLSSPATYMQSFLDGVSVWAYNVLPALFPFAVITSVAAKFFPKCKISVCKPLFGVKADGIFFASLLCGYPIGAKSISESRFDSDTATRICSFCSTASPIFIVATVGAKLLGNATATLILLFSHWASAVFCGFAYRKKTEEESLAQNEFSAADIGNTVTSSLLSVLSVGGLIALFYLFGDIVKSFLPNAICNSISINFAMGLLEMTNGIISVCATCDTATATVLSSFLLAFGGMCVFAQSLTFLSTKNVKPLQFLKIKFLQGSIATIISFIAVKIFL